ncbi:MAG: UDP-N-acetylglucosamine 1-carboxyvinyltransferase [Eubacteriales bacterium]|nr:UDP-N-acetylglucosamine 1-carboxyvinyltransferase [Eubacteriales bacterium]
MQMLEINSKRQLNGSLKIHGAKNSVLPILCATVLVNGVSVIHKCPYLSDVDVTLNILKYLGARVYRSGETVVVDSRNISRSNILEQYMSELRSSIIFLGALASRTGEACLFLPGGCEIGLRPIDLHLKGLKSLGYNVFTNGYDVCAVRENPQSAEIVLPFPSVGATENIILASVFNKGKTTVINAAREPEIADLASFLNKAGAKIYGASTPTITVQGVDSLHSVEHTVIPDRILASTMISACAACSGKIELSDVDVSHLLPTKAVFEEMGCSFKTFKSSIIVKAPKRPNRVRFIETMAYPGFPTDSQAPVMAALTVANGTSVIKENIFENRFRHAEQLNLFGADITVNDKFAIVNGVSQLHNADAKCTDLRGGAAVVIAALTADGKSRIRDIHHIDRGYEKIENQLSQLGADIKRI